MVPLSKIRADLKEIRYYYGRKEVFDAAIGGACFNDVLNKVRQYSYAVQAAPPRLHDLYISLYVKNYTQEALAMELGYEPEHIRRLNKQLLLYLQTKIPE